MNNHLSNSIDWKTILPSVLGPPSTSTVPQKLFIWNHQGIYLGYHYPNPRHGHYIGGERLLGKSITEVLPSQMAQHVKSSVAQVVEMKIPMVGMYQLSINNQPYRVVVRFLPYDDCVVGAVNDYPTSHARRSESV